MNAMEERVDLFVLSPIMRGANHASVEEEETTMAGKVTSVDMRPIQQSRTLLAHPSEVSTAATDGAKTTAEWFDMTNGDALDEADNGGSWLLGTSHDTGDVQVGDSAGMKAAIDFFDSAGGGPVRSNSHTAGRCDGVLGNYSYGMTDVMDSVADGGSPHDDLGALAECLDPGGGEATVGTADGGVRNIFNEVMEEWNLDMEVAALTLNALDDAEVAFTGKSCAFVFPYLKTKQKGHKRGQGTTSARHLTDDGNVGEAAADCGSRCDSSSSKCCSALMVRAQHLLADETTAAIGALASCLSESKAVEMESSWAAYSSMLRKGIVALETSSHEPAVAKELVGLGDRLCNFMESILHGK